MSAPQHRPFAHTLDLLRSVGLRPTRQRLALARLLFERGDRHLSAEQLHQEAEGARMGVSLATVYNTLNQFVALGLLREVVVEPGRSIFDTNTGDHHHFYFVDTGALQDIGCSELALSCMPAAPAGTDIERVDVVVRVRSRP